MLLGAEDGDAGAKKSKPHRSSSSSQLQRQQSKASKTASNPNLGAVGAAGVVVAPAVPPTQWERTEYNMSHDDMWRVRIKKSSWLINDKHCYKEEPKDEQQTTREKAAKARKNDMDAFLQNPLDYVYKKYIEKEVIYPIKRAMYAWKHPPPVGIDLQLEEMAERKEMEERARNQVDREEKYDLIRDAWRKLRFRRHHVHHLPAKLMMQPGEEQEAFDAFVKMQKESSIENLGVRDRHEMKSPPIIEVLRPIEQVEQENRDNNRPYIGGRLHMYRGREKVWALRNHISTVNALYPGKINAVFPEDTLLPDWERLKKEEMETQHTHALKMRAVKMFKGALVSINKIWVKVKSKIGKKQSAQIYDSSDKASSNLVASSIEAQTDRSKSDGNKNKKSKGLLSHSHMFSNVEVYKKAFEEGEAIPLVSSEEAAEASKGDVYNIRYFDTRIKLNKPVYETMRSLEAKGREMENDMNCETKSEANSAASYERKYVSQVSPKNSKQTSFSVERENPPNPAEVEAENQRHLALRSQSRKVKYKFRKELFKKFNTDANNNSPDGSIGPTTDFLTTEGSEEESVGSTEAVRSGIFSVGSIENPNIIPIKLTKMRSFNGLSRRLKPGVLKSLNLFGGRQKDEKLAYIREQAERQKAAEEQSRLELQTV